MNPRGSLLTRRLVDLGGKRKARQVGLEPTTSRLTAGCSTIELLPNLEAAGRRRAGGGECQRAKHSIASAGTVKAGYKLYAAPELAVRLGTV